MKNVQTGVKRIVCMLMIVVMAIGVMPVTTFAYGSKPDKCGLKATKQSARVSIIRSYTYSGVIGIKILTQDECLTCRRHRSYSYSITKITVDGKQVKATKLTSDFGTSSTSTKTAVCTKADGTKVNMTENFKKSYRGYYVSVDSGTHTIKVTVGGKTYTKKVTISTNYFKPRIGCDGVTQAGKLRSGVTRQIYTDKAGKITDLTTKVAGSSTKEFYAPDYKTLAISQINSDKKMKSALKNKKIKEIRARKDNDIVSVTVYDYDEKKTYRYTGNKIVKTGRKKNLPKSYALSNITMPYTTFTVKTNGEDWVRQGNEDKIKITIKDTKGNTTSYIFNDTNYSYYK